VPEELTVTIEDRETGLERVESFFRTGGVWTIRDLPAGHYRVSATAPEGAGRAEVTLAEGESRAGVRIAMSLEPQPLAVPRPAPP
jgi:hypothetical protein